MRFTPFLFTHIVLPLLLSSHNNPPPLFCFPSLRSLLPLVVQQITFHIVYLCNYFSAGPPCLWTLPFRPSQNFGVAVCICV